MPLQDLFEELPRVSVSQYTAAIKKALEGQIPPAWVTGELSNVRAQSSGHFYFSLKDSGAQLPAVMFRGQAARLKFKPKDGMQVCAFGEISVYEPHGRYQLMVREMEESGEGRLYREFERLKRALAEEGLFDSDRKRALPPLPLRVAIVTSPTGAALQDFVRILQRRSWGGVLHVYPTRVQGAGSAAEVAAAIDLANAVGGYDALVVARGGGSLEDLWSFNEERVARAVFRSRIPVVSGIGHEIDFTLCDFAADVRAETPSGAAEMISSAYAASVERLERARSELQESLAFRMEALKGQLDGARRELRSVSPVRALERAFLRIDELGTRFAASFRESVYDRRERLRAEERRLLNLDVAGELTDGRRRLVDLKRALERSLGERVAAQRGRLDVLSATLKALSPSATLQRGYALLEDEAGSPLTRAAGVRPGTKVRAKLHDGSLDMQVESVDKA